MKKLKHSKFKNTGILFELLTRQLTSDVLSGKGDNSPAVDIIREFFTGKTELAKELELYNILNQKKIKDAGRAYKLIEATTSIRKTLSSKRLSSAKYNLIKTIKENYNINEFFDFRVNNYKTLAGIYTLFEYGSTENPITYLNAETIIKEHIIAKPAVIKEDTNTGVISRFKNESADTRKLSYFMAIDKFNEKYKSFNAPQQKLLYEFIYTQNNTSHLRDFILNEVSSLRTSINKLKKNVKAGSATRIKLDEMVNILGTYKKLTKFSDNHIASLMRFYELEEALVNQKAV